MGPLGAPLFPTQPAAAAQPAPDPVPVPTPAAPDPVPVPTPAAPAPAPAPVWPQAQAAAAPLPPAAAPVLSPDGQWMWDGTQWVPAAVPPPPPAGGAPYGGAPRPYGGGPYQAPSGGTNGLAIASLVLGILWLFGLGSLLAVIFGHLGRRQIKERNEGGNGLATAGLVLGYVGLAGALAFILTVATAGSVINSQVIQGQDAGVKSDLRNAATAEESNLTDTDRYYAGVIAPDGALANEGLSFSSSFDYAADAYQINAEYVGSSGAPTTAANTGYCLSATSASGHTFAYNSALGGLQPGLSATCP